VIDAKGDNLPAVIRLAGEPDAAVADGTDALFVNIENTHRLQPIDANKSVVTVGYKLAK
jgi:hypothetical protein